MTHRLYLGREARIKEIPNSYIPRKWSKIDEGCERGANKLNLSRMRLETSEFKI